MGIKAAFIILALLFAQLASAIPQNIPLHGRITTASGVPVSGNVAMQFRIYNASSGGTALYDTGTIFVQADSSGLYNYTMASVNLPFDQQYYLGVATNGDPEGARISLGSVGYAYRSNAADTLNPANNYTANSMNLFQLLLNPGTAAAAPIVLASGANLSTPENGALEFDGSGLYFTVSGNREKIALIPDIVSYLSNYYTQAQSDATTAILNASISNLNSNINSS